VIEEQSQTTCMVDTAKRRCRIKQEWRTRTYYLEYSYFLLFIIVAAQFGRKVLLVHTEQSALGGRTTILLAAPREKRNALSCCSTVQYLYKLFGIMNGRRWRCSWIQSSTNWKGVFLLDASYRRKKTRHLSRKVSESAYTNNELFSLLPNGSNALASRVSRA
jgi:hypothetical protein